MMAIDMNAIANPGGALPPSTGKTSVQPRGPPNQSRRTEARDVQLDRSPPIRVERWLEKQSVNQRLDVQAGTADNHRLLPGAAHRANPLLRLASEPPCPEPFTRRNDVDTMVLDPPELSRGRFRRANVQPPIDLPRVGRDHFDREVIGKSQRDGCLSDRRGPNENWDATVAQSGAPIRPARGSRWSTAHGRHGGEAGSRRGR